MHSSKKGCQNYSWCPQTRAHGAFIRKIAYPPFCRFKNVRRFCLGQFMYKQIKNSSPPPPPCIIPNLVLNRSVHNYYTRGTQEPHTVYRHTQKVASSFVNTGPRYWSDLPRNVTHNTISTFNRSHERHLRQAQNDASLDPCFFSNLFVGQISQWS